MVAESSYGVAVMESQEIDAAGGCTGTELQLNNLTTTKIADSLENHDPI
jgi:hypothetical protein